MKKKHSNKKNRSLEESDGFSPPKGKQLGNSPKKSKLGSPSVSTEETMVRNRDIPPEVVSVDYISNQITIEANASSPISNIEKRGRLEYIDSQRGNILHRFVLHI